MAVRKRGQLTSILFGDLKPLISRPSISNHAGVNIAILAFPLSADYLHQAGRFTSSGSLQTHQACHGCASLHGLFQVRALIANFSPPSRFPQSLL
jgi:hypothetical protein